MNEGNKEERSITASESMIATKEAHPETDNGMDIAKEMQKSVLAELNSAIKVGQDHYKGRDFYIEMFFRKYSYLPDNHVKPHTLVEPVCPTPAHGHSVWKVHGSGTVEFLWTVPHFEICKEMLQHSAHVPKEEYPLLKHIVDFADGTLRKRAKLLNGEI